MKIENPVQNIKMHIHPSSPNSSISEESAATKIQAGFRGYRVRKQLKDGDSTPNRNRLSNNIHRNDCNDDTKCHQLKSSDSLEKEKCATKIQAGIRGFLVRKKLAHQKMAANAATKIQAGFRGFRARKQLRDSRE